MMKTMTILSLIWLAFGCRGAVAQGSAMERTIYTSDFAIEEAFPLALPVTVDVMYCDKSEGNAWAAGEFAASLATFARITNSSYGSTDTPDAFVRAVRLRSTTGGSLSTGYESGRDAIYLSEDSMFVRKLANLINGASGRNLDVLISRDAIPGYMRVVFCAINGPTEQTKTRVFVQAYSRSQEEIARTIIDALLKNFPDFVVASSIDYVAASPDNNEVRYFYGEDERNGRLIASAIAAQLGSDVTAKLLSGNAKPGTIEIWLGKEALPVGGKTFVICEGEHVTRCAGKYDYFISCYGNYEAFSKAQGCSKISKTQISSKGGNKCGYTLTLITCQ
ncbi:hypothetical protein NKI36_14305 [Mesorhizobium caraganae]|uniref:Uncharacterized protein n=1 Tax=Mesorhizobium caraganae TaxID=483206 RepID=A0ABV1YZP0_9HYPH